MGITITHHGYNNPMYGAHEMWVCIIIIHGSALYMAKYG